MLILSSALVLATIAAPALIRLCGRAAFGALALVPAAGFAWVTSLFLNGSFEGGRFLETHIAWMPAAHLELAFRMDALAGLFSLIILGVGSLVLLYCWGYFDAAPRRLAYFGAQMVGFATAMFGLVTADSFLLLYVMWEITSLLSFLLVSYYGERASARRAAQQALMVTVLGGLAMLVGFIALGHITGAWSFSAVARLAEVYGPEHLAQTPYLTLAIVLILAGALSKSAIAPTHFWLPVAMAAPTPVSAYLHSAAMVKAGIYLVARLAPELHVVATWHLVVLPLGAFTMALGGWMALRQTDLKLILAYGTVSQLGLITAIVAVGSREAMLAGLALTVAHSLFKAALFMVVGAIDHATGTRDITTLAGLGRAQPGLYAVAIVAALSMAGVPPLLGFVAKESTLEALLHEELLVGMPRTILTVVIVAGSTLTVAYALRFLWGAFGSKGSSTPSDAVRGMHSLSLPLWLPPTVLAALSLALGIRPGPLSAAIGQHLEATFGPDQHSHLALWHGWTLPLALSTLALTAGALLHWQRAVVAAAHFQYPALGSANQAYDTVIDALRTLSLRTTASTQRGSLQLNVTIIFVVLIALPVAMLIRGDLTTVRMVVAQSPWQVAAAAVIVAAAVAATRLDNRLSGVIVVGITGYAVAFIFALHGAPDLALTQLLVETLVVVVFMLVLRRMPASTEWKQEPKLGRLRSWLAAAVGLAVVLVAIFAINARSSAPISGFMPQLAKEIGHGSNTVNVLLVDLRAWDTFGEITVLVIAATGSASLIYRTRSFTRHSRRPTLQTTGHRWLASGRRGKDPGRSLLVDVSAHALFPSMIAVSLYFFFTGHNAPGGGFAGGLVAALALVLRYLAGGRAELEETLPVDASRVLSLGLLLSSGAVLVPLCLGLPPLTTGYASLEVPVVGSVSLPSALVFDAGVYLIVVGLTLRLVDSLGARLDEDEEERQRLAAERAAEKRHKQKGAL